MGEITSRTIGPESIGGGDPADMTIEQQIALDEAQASEYEQTAAEVLEFTGRDTEPDKAPEPEQSVAAAYFRSEPYIAVEAYLRTGPLQLILGLDEAGDLFTALREALEVAEKDQ